MLKSTLLLGIICFSSLCLCPNQCVAQSENLKGIGFVVLLCSVDKELTDAGVDKNAIQTSAELKMRSAGIIVVDDNHKMSKAEIASSAKLKCIAVMLTVHGLKIENTPLCAFDAFMDASEGAKLLHNPNVYVPVTFWSSGGSVGYFGTSRSDLVKTYTDNLTDAFCNDYLKANPKPSPMMQVP